jgi:hypothetical protein
MQTRSQTQSQTQRQPKQQHKLQMQTRSQTKQQVLLKLKQQSENDVIIERFETIKYYINNKIINSNYNNSFLRVDDYNVLDFFHKNVANLLKITELTNKFNKNAKIYHCLEVYKFINLHLLTYVNICLKNHKKLRMLLSSTLLILKMFQKTIEYENSVNKIKNNGIIVDENLEFNFRSVLMQTQLLIINRVLPNIEDKVFKKNVLNN